MKKGIIIMCWLVLSVWTLSAQSTEATFILEHDEGVVTASWNIDETQILSADEAGFVKIWSAEDGDLVNTIDHNGNPLTHAIWFSDNAHIVSADESGLVQYTSAETGDILQSWQIEGIPLSLELNADETRIFVFTSEGNGAIWSTDGDDIVTVSRSGAIRGADLSADETQIRAWSEDGRIVVWDVETGETVETFSVPYRGMLLGVEFNHDDTRLLAWFTSGAVLAYETNGVSVTERPLSSVQHRSFVQNAIWSDDETSYMSWAGDDTVNVWNTETGQSEQMLRHEDWVVGAEWNMNESRILSWSHVYVNVWDQDMQEAYFEHDNLVRGAIFNSDATKVLSWSWDGTARIWDV